MFGHLEATAVSSGFCLGSCNWLLQTKHFKVFLHEQQEKLGWPDAPRACVLNYCNLVRFVSVYNDDFLRLFPCLELSVFAN